MELLLELDVRELAWFISEEWLWIALKWNEHVRDQIWEVILGSKFESTSRKNLSSRDFRLDPLRSNPKKIRKLLGNHLRASKSNSLYPYIQFPVKHRILTITKMFENLTENRTICEKSLFQFRHKVTILTENGQQFTSCKYMYIRFRLIVGWVPYFSRISAILAKLGVSGRFGGIDFFGQK